MAAGALTGRGWRCPQLDGVTAWKVMNDPRGKDMILIDFVPVDVLHQILISGNALLRMQGRLLCYRDTHCYVAM